MISLVGDQIAWIVWCRRKADVGQIARRRLKRGIERRRVAFVGRMDRRRNNDAGVEVDRVLGLVAQTRRAVLLLAIFASGSVGLVQSSFESFLPLRFRSSRTRSSIVDVATPLSWAMRVSISPDTSAAVTPHDGSQRGVGLHGRVRSPFTSPRSATSPRTQPKTFSWTSCGKRLRVFDSQE
jgi:hypothetical protein